MGYSNSTCIFDPEYPEESEEATEEGLHPEWTLTEWGLNSGSLLQMEDEGQGFSCNLLLREDPELDEEQFPAGYHVVAAAGATNDDGVEAGTDGTNQAGTTTAAVADDDVAKRRRL